MKLHHTQARAIREAGCDYEIAEAALTLSAPWREAETFDDPREAVLAAKSWAARRLEDHSRRHEDEGERLESGEPKRTCDDPPGEASNPGEADASANLGAGNLADEGSAETSDVVQERPRRRYARRNGDAVCEAMNSCCDAAGRPVGDLLIRFAEANSIIHARYDQRTPSGLARMRMSLSNIVRARARKTGQFFGMNGEVLTWTERATCGVQQ